MFFKTRNTKAASISSQFEIVMEKQKGGGKSLIMKAQQ